MKQLALLLLCTFMLQEAFCQSISDRIESRIEKRLECHEINQAAAELFIEKLQLQEYDSARIVIDYWNNHCRQYDHLIRANILLNLLQELPIQYYLNKEFSQYLADFEPYDPMSPIQSWSKPIFPHVFERKFEGELQQQFNKLLAKQAVNTDEFLICTILGGGNIDFYKTLQSEQYSGTRFKRMYDADIEELKNTTEYFASFGPSIWHGTKDLKQVGAKGGFLMLFGANNKKLNYSLDIELLFGDSKTNLQALHRETDSIHTTRDFFNARVALGIGYNLLDINKHNLELNLSSGARTAIVIVGEDKESADDDQYINGYSFQLALRYKIFLSYRGYVSFSPYFELTNFTQNDVLNLNGNAIGLSVSIGIINNVMKSSRYMDLKKNKHGYPVKYY